jgi:hypothetical protein
MALPHFSGILGINRKHKSVRYQKVMSIVLKINNRLYNESLDSVSKRFPIGSTFFYFSKYGGQLKFKVFGYNRGNGNSDNESWLRVEENSYSYDPNCKTLYEIRWKEY